MSRESTPKKVPTFAWLLVVSLLMVTIVGWFSWHFGSSAEFQIEGMATASRTLNILLGVVLTTIALIVPLTSNLYSPKLVRLFVTQPIIVGGLITLVLAIMFNLSTNFFSIHHQWYETIAAISVILAYFGLAGIIPYLFMISRFLRPSYFIPTLAERAMLRIGKIRASQSTRKDSIEVVEIIDVLSNIARTSMKRNDQQLIILILHFLREILCGIIELPENRPSLKQVGNALFVSGITREGKQHLEESGLWPEAYVLFQLVRVAESCDQQQSVVFAESGKVMVESLQHAADNQREDVIELIIISMNALMRSAINNGNATKFQNLSYYYVLAADAIYDLDIWMNELIRHLKHYARVAEESHVLRARETVVYDLSALCLYLYKSDKKIAFKFLNYQLVPYLRFAMGEHSHLARIALQAVIKLYWEIKVMQDDTGSNSLFELFLKDSEHYHSALQLMLKDNRPLHWELNDRLLRFSYLSKPAQKLAEEFLQSKES